MGSDLPGAALHIGLLVRSAAKTMTMAGFKIPTSRRSDASASGTSCHARPAAESRQTIRSARGSDRMSL
jgi:hypothetical protein